MSTTGRTDNLHLLALLLLFVPVPQAMAAGCAAIMELEYSQRNTIANVRGTIDNEDCAASSGDYKLAVKIRDANGELKTLEFPETWQRLDNQTVEFKGEYPIGENVDLVSVRTKQMHCTCAGTPVE